MTRREAREQAFILIFEKSFQPDSEISELVEFADENNVAQYWLRLYNETRASLSFKIEKKDYEV